MEVTKSMLAEVMSIEQREQFQEDYRAELAQKHILSRQKKKVDAAINENNRKLASLELLTGGVPTVTMYRHLQGLNEYLVENYTYPIPQDPRVLSREFAVSMRNKRPYTDADMDKYAVNVAELIEYSQFCYRKEPDAFDFWLYAIYGGDWKLMIDREAEGLGFERKTK
jgi:hypothetical protein